MTTNNENGFVPKPPRTKRLNRNMLIVIFAVILVLVLYIFIEALSVPQRSGGSGSIQVHKSLVAKATSQIKQLPDSYADAAKINQYLGRDLAPKVVTKVPPELQAQITHPMFLSAFRFPEIRISGKS